jgi:hypothetical protein
MTDIAEELRVLDSDAHRELVELSKPIGSRGGAWAPLSGEERQRIVPEDMRLHNGVTGIDDPHQSLDLWAEASRMRPRHCFESEIFITEMNSSGGRDGVDEEEKNWTEKRQEEAILCMEWEERGEGGGDWGREEETECRRRRWDVLVLLSASRRWVDGIIRKSQQTGEW